MNLASQIARVGNTTIFRFPSFRLRVRRLLASGRVSCLFRTLDSRYSAAAPFPIARRVLPFAEAILVAYYKLIWYALLGIGEYNRVRQMTIGFVVCWCAICVGASNSIYLRSMGADIPMTDLTAAARYLSIIAAMLQVTAPDFGLGLFHGRDRRVLWASVTIGLLVAIVTITLQQWGA